MTTLDRVTFFNFARNAPFGGRLTQEQVDGLNLILDYWNAHLPDGDVRWLAYILATVFHETGARMSPVREAFAPNDVEARKRLSNRKYAAPDPTTGHSYYGRGYVQITHIENYDRLGKILGLDLVKNPDLALDNTIALRILFEGMMEGLSGKGDFTRYALSDFFNKEVDDPVNARKIINGKDKAGLVASYHLHFLNSINAAIDAAAKQERPPEVSKDAAKADGPDSLLKDKTSIGAMVLGSGGFVGSMIGAISNPWALAAFALLAIGAFLVITGRIELKYKKGA